MAEIGYSVKHQAMCDPRQRPAAILSEGIEWYRHSWKAPLAVEEIEERLANLPSDLNIASIREIQARVSDTRHFSFAVLGDSKGEHVIFRRVLKSALSHNPDFVLYTGDLVGSGLLRQYVDELKFLKNFHVPIVVVAGNHDLENEGYRIFYHIFGPVDFYFDVGEYRFICLDNNEKQLVRRIIELPADDLEYDRDRGFDEVQLDQLETLLQEKPHNFIVMHEPPPLGPWDHSFDANAERFIRLTTTFRDRISRVFCGHIHGYDRRVFDGITYIIAAGAGARIRDRGYITPRYNYVIVTVDGDEVRDEVFFVD